MFDPESGPSLFHATRHQQRQLLVGGLAFFTFIIGVFLSWPRTVFSDSYLPHAYCYLQKPTLVWTHVVADTLIGASYVAISFTLVYFVYRGRRNVPFHWVILQFGLFIVACGGTHWMEVVTVWVPVYVLAAGLKGFTALVSVSTAVSLPFAVPRALEMIQNAQLSEANRLAMESALAQRDEAQIALERSNDRLEQQVRERTRQLEMANESLRDEVASGVRLRASLVAMASIVESSDDAIVGIDLDGTMTSWNKGAARLYGYSAEEAIGKPDTILSPWDRREETSSMLARIADGDRIESYETQRVTKKGEVLDISLTISPIRAASGVVVGTSAIGRDITARKRAEEALKVSEAQYRLLFDRNPLPMWVFNRSNMAFLGVNESAVRHYGYAREEFEQMTVVDLSPVADIPAARRNWSKRSPNLQQMGLWKHRKKDGTVIDVEITANDLDFRGIDAGLVLANDVTERLKAEALLRESNEKFTRAFRASPLGITISTEKKGQYLDVNPAFLTMMDYDRDSVVGHTIDELQIWVDPMQREVFLRQMDIAAPVKIIEARFRTRSGGVRLVQLAAERIQIENQACVLSIVQDVTEIRQLEHQFRQAQKMEAVGRLAGGVAHDFNNLLGVIIGYSEIATSALPSDAPVIKSLEQIGKAADRAAALTRQLLAFSRRQVLQPSILNLNTVVHSMSKMLLRMIGEHISLALKPGEVLGSVRADLSQIEQILMNLAVNSRDAMPSGGKITIETGNVELDEAYDQRDDVVQPGAYVMLSFTDTGVGMDSATMSRIFEPFYTTKSPGEGTGLGLSTVYGIVRQSGGHIWVYSEPGRGTTFKIYLPRTDELAEPLLSVVPPANLPTGDETILVVEDDAPLRGMTVAMLEKAGYKVLQAEDPVTALEVTNLHGGKIDLLLTDVIMPGMQGPDLGAELRRRRPDIKVLYMSGYMGDLLAKPELLGPGAVLLPKPFSKSTLLNMLRAVLDKRG